MYKDDRRGILVVLTFNVYNILMFEQKPTNCDFNFSSEIFKEQLILMWYGVATKV